MRPLSRLLLAIVLALSALPAAAQGELPEATQRNKLRYFRTQLDPRMCPTCGGYWVHVVNRSVTRCADRSFAPVCQAARIDWSGLWIDLADLPALEADAAAGRAIVLGRLVPGSEPLDGPTLVASAAWRSATDAAPSGALYRVRQLPAICPPYADCVPYCPLGTDCTTWLPKPTYSALVLNWFRMKRIDQLDLTAVDATPEQLREAHAAQVEGALLVAGKVERVLPDPRESPQVLIGTQIYLPVRPSPVLGGSSLR